MKNKVHYLVFLVAALLFSQGIQAKTLSIFVVDNNLSSLYQYVDSIYTVKRRDRVVVYDITTSQIIYESSFSKAKDVSRKVLDKLGDRINSAVVRREKRLVKSPGLIARNGVTQNIDLPSALNFINDYLRVYGSDFTKIDVMFFGNSYQANIGVHDFSKGVPSDGFLIKEQSPFAKVEGTSHKGMRIAIFFDNSPESQTENFRFYNKLFEKKLGMNLAAFNDNATFGGLPENSLIESFHANEVRVIQTTNDSDCPTQDVISTNVLPNSSAVEITIMNDCRGNSEGFVVHNGVSIPVTYDADGFAAVELKLRAGENITAYTNINGEQAPIYQQDEVGADFVENLPDPATNRITIKVTNTLRLDGDFVTVFNKTGGNLVENKLKISNGVASKSFVLVEGVNSFSVIGLDGSGQPVSYTHRVKCGDELSFNEKVAVEYGVLYAKVTNSCRADGEQVAFNYEGKEYMAISTGGIAEEVILLHKESNSIFYNNFDNETVLFANVKIRDFKSLLRMGIKYSDNVQLELNIFEPNIALLEPIISDGYKADKVYEKGHVNSHTSRNSSSGMLLYNDTVHEENFLSDADVNYKQIYVVRKTDLMSGDLSMYVDYFNRHGFTNLSLGQTSDPLCGERSRGGVWLTYEILNHGSIEKGNKFMNPSVCEKGVPNNKAKELLLIKKVHIK